MAATQRKTVGFLQRKIFLKLGSLWSPNFLLLSREITTWGRAWMAISTLVVLSGLTLGTLLFLTCLLPMWLARVKLETAAMTKHFALKRKFFDGAHYYAGTVFNLPHKILQAERDQKVDEVRTDGFSQRLTPLEIMSHSED
jgi:hypothetical protein